MNIKSIFFLLVQFQLIFSNLAEHSCISQIGNRDIYRNDYTHPESIQGENFVVHFTSSDVDSQFVNNQWMNLQSNAGLAQSILDLSEFALEHYIQMGWEVPPPDCNEQIDDIESPDHCVNFGGNSLYDIYIANDAAGMVVPETPYPVEPYTGGYTSYMKISTFLNAYDALPYWAEHVIAHELHHAIQMRYGYSVSGTPGNYVFNGWFFEQTASYMENVIFPNSNHLFTMLANCNVTTPLTFPEYGVDYPGDLYQYRSALWQKYLVEAYNDSTIIRTLWEDYGTQYATGNPVSLFPIYNNAVDQVTEGVYTLSDAFSEYAIWRYFTGNRSIPGEYFHEGAGYCTSLISDSAETEFTFFSETGGMHSFNLPSEPFSLIISSENFNHIRGSYLTLTEDNQVIIHNLFLEDENSIFNSYDFSEHPQVLIINSNYTGSISNEIAFTLTLNESILIGDVNNDGQINVVDIVQLIEYIFLYEINQSFDFISETDLVRTDINADNQLNIMDVVLLVNIILGD